MTPTPEESVGYGKPPKASQFKKGQSGNPAGRKKGSRSHSEILAKAMNETVSVVVNGRKKAMPMIEVAFKQQMKQAAEGNRHSVRLMMSLLGEVTDREEARQAGSPLDAEARKASDSLFLAALRDQAKTLKLGDGQDD